MKKIIAALALTIATVNVNAQKIEKIVTKDYVNQLIKTLIDYLENKSTHKLTI